jgi:hypothetical protein
VVFANPIIPNSLEPLKSLNPNSHESLDYEKSKAIRGEILSVNLTDYLGKRFGEELKL